jgi:hypothetical protein
MAIYGAIIEPNAYILYADGLVSKILPLRMKNLCKGRSAHGCVKRGQKLDRRVDGLLALAIVCAMLVGANLPFFGNVVGNIMGLVSELGKNGLVGLIALGIILWLFANRRMA